MPSVAFVTHAAVAGDAQAGMVAIMRHLDPQTFGHLDEVKTVFDRYFTTVDFEFGHVFLSAVSGQQKQEPFYLFG
jgi:hypothetical protein